MLTPAADAAAKEALEMANVPLDGRPLLGVAVRRCFNANREWLPHQLRARLKFLPPRGNERMLRLKARLIATLREVIAQTGAHVVFLPSYRAAFENDTPVCQAAASGLPDGTSTVMALSDPRLYKAVTGRLDALLAGRMHPAILAAGMGTPSVGLSYNPKFQGTFELLGYPQRVLDVGQFADSQDPKVLATLLTDAMADGAAQRRQLSATASRLAKQTRQGLASTLNGGELQNVALTGRYSE
jgi:polysaccharide pyruvyl transferase WcaK-like protein